MLGLPAARRLAETLQEPARAALEALLLELARDAGDRAKAAWRSHKAPMACYWKVVSVYARHIALALRILGRQAAAAAPAPAPEPAGPADDRLELQELADAVQQETLEQG